MLSLGLMTACDDELEEVPLGQDVEYLPTQEGHTLTYQVDTTFYDVFFDTVYTHSGQIREVFLGSNTDANGNEITQLAHYYRSDANQNVAWDKITPRIWYISKNDQQIEKVEENLRFIKLSYPIIESQKWAGNSFIDTEDERWSYYRDWLYEYQNIGGAYTVNDQVYDNTVMVVQNDFIDLYAANYSVEVFAKDVGLIYKELMVVDWDTSKDDIDDNDPIATEERLETPWPDRANQGQYIVMKLIP